MGRCCNFVHLLCIQQLATLPLVFPCLFPAFYTIRGIYHPFEINDLRGFSLFSLLSRVFLESI